MRKITITILLFILITTNIFASSGGSQLTLISDIGVSVVAATILGIAAHFLKQPLLIAYIAAGVIIGPEIGIKLISNSENIEIISEIGLILLLFIIGLEINLKKLREAGKSLIVSGTFQFILCTILALTIFSIINFQYEKSKFDILYLAICIGISSTAIVVKLLYEKFEMDTLAGRLTLGILVFQDIWAIIFLGVQPNLNSPEIVGILISFIKGGVLIVISVVISKYLLTRLFKLIAKQPELVLITSLGWCFFICGMAGALGLSIEMGALIAGVSLSAFPYNIDVTAKIINIRDFFITLFFVSLGLKIPNPFSDLNIIYIALVVAFVAMATRMLVLFPLLRTLKNGNRVSLLVPINLMPISEFALVITSIGYASGHISKSTLSVIIFVFVITAIISTYMIKYSHKIQKSINRLIIKLGIKDIATSNKEDVETDEKKIAILGFFRVASSLVKEIEYSSVDGVDTKDLAVVDFNPDVHKKLTAAGIRTIYGDISNIDTLHHADIEGAKLVISTVPDFLLRGTDNLKLIKTIKRIAPDAKIIVTSDTISGALKMYDEGAAYVLIPKIEEGKHLAKIINVVMNGEDMELQQSEVEMLKAREEVID